MSVVRELIAAIEADHQDLASQMVIADYLQAEGDPRGELIVLDHLDRTSEITDPEVLERLLLLAAEYSFPRVEPDDPMLPFELYRGRPLEYRLHHDRSQYSIRWLQRRLLVRKRGIDETMDDEDDYSEASFELALGKRWTETETNIILTILGDAIRAQTGIHGLRFPWEKLPLPVYDGGPLRCYPLPQEFRAPRAILETRYGLAARDYNRWNFIWLRLKSIERARK